MTYNSNKFNVFLPIVLAVCVVGGVFLGSRLNQVPGAYENGVGFDKVNDVLNYIFEEYVDSVNRDDLIEGSLATLLNNLDPHSLIFPRRTLNRIASHWKEISKG